MRWTLLRLPESRGQTLRLQNETNLEELEAECRGCVLVCESKEVKDRATHW